MTEAPVPADIEAEKAVLGAAMLNGEHPPELAALEERDFLFPAHREIFGALRDLAARGRPPDAILIADELKARGWLSRLDGGAGYLLTLANRVESVGNLRHYVNLVQAKSQLRRLIATASDIIAKARNQADDVPELLAEASQAVMAIELGYDTGKPVGPPSSVEESLHIAIERHRAPKAVSIPTGLGRFDEVIGGLRAGQLVVIAARPGMGKSALALDWLLNAAGEQIPSLLCSYEMSKQELMERAFSKLSGVNGSAIARAQMGLREIERVKAAAGHLKTLPLWIETRTLSAIRLCAVIRQWLAEQKRACYPGPLPRAIVAVDYLGLIPSVGDGKDDTKRTLAQELGVITRMFKLLAVELGIPIVVCCQLNRESARNERKPMLSDLRDSGAVEQDANMVVFPWWANPPTRDVMRHPALLIVGKNRSGPMGEVDVDWMPATTTFTDNEDWARGPEQQELAQ